MNGIGTQILYRVTCREIRVAETCGKLNTIQLLLLDTVSLNKQLCYLDEKFKLNNLIILTWPLPACIKISLTFLLPLR